MSAVLIRATSLGQLPGAKTIASPTAADQTQPQQDGPVVTIDDPRIASWAVAPAETAEHEAVEFYQALEVLRDDSQATADYMTTVAEMVKSRREELERLRSEARMLSAQGMGELLDLERVSWELGDPNSLGFLKKIKKELKRFEKNVVRPASQPIKDAGRLLEKNLIRPVAKPVDKALKEIDKNVIRPVAKPIDKALKEVDRAVIRPWSSPLHDNLKKVEKYTVRPAAKEAQKGIATLDKYVPGWTTLLDFIAPIPIGTIIGGAASAARGGNLATALVGSVLPGGGPPVIQGAVQVADKTAQIAALAAEPATQFFEASSSSVVGQPVGGQIANFGWTLSKGTLTFINTKGSFLEKLQAVTIEALSGFTLAVSIAAAVASGGASVAALQAALNALNAGVTILKAKQAADALKAAAREVRDRAQLELDRIAAEEAALKAEIAKIMAQIDEIRRQREAVQAAQKKLPAAAAPIAKAAERLGVSETTIVIGGLAAIAGVIVVVTSLQEDH